MKVLIDKYGDSVEAEVLFVVNNNEKNNHSILGVFTTPQLANRAIEKQKMLIRNMNKNTAVPSMSIKCVVLNGSEYEGFRTFPGDMFATTAEKLGENPNIRRSLDSVIKEDFHGVEVTMSPETVEHSIYY